MNAAYLPRRSIASTIALGFVMAAITPADAQIFRRPNRAAPTDPGAAPPRGLFPGRALRNGPAQGGRFSDGTVPGRAILGTVPGNSIPGAAVPSNTAPGIFPPQEEIFVVVPLDDKPFQVEPTDYVRLTAGGPPGCEFSTKIEGPARMHRKVFVAGSTEGKYLPGTDEAEYEFAMTGVGKVKIEMITTVPNGPAPTVMTYQFEVVPPKP